MARRAYVPTIPPPPSTRGGAGSLTPPPPSAAPVSVSAPTSSVGPPTSPSLGGPPSVPPPRPSAAPESRRSVPSPPLTTDGVSMQAVAQLLDRLIAADEAAFIVSWIEAAIAGRPRIDPPLAVRLLRAYRETGRIDKARELASQLPSLPSSWHPLDLARLSIERAILGLLDGRADHAEGELKNASRAIASAPKGGGVREQLDMHLTQAQVELKLNRVAQASSAARLAEHIAERLEDGAWRAPVSMMLGHLSLRLADPKTAIKHYTTALARAPARGTVAMSANGYMAQALAAVGRTDEARMHAQKSIALAKDISAGWHHADMYDVLAIVEIASDRPLSALAAVDEASAVLAELEQPMLRYQLAARKTWILSMLGRAQAARQWLSRTEKLRNELAVVDAVDEQELIATRARALESAGAYYEALAVALPHIEKLPDSYVTGTLNLVAGRVSLATGDEPTASACVERVALSGERHGWLFPDRQASAALWRVAMKSGDSRVVRYAERMTSPVPPPPSSTTTVLEGRVSSPELPPESRADLGREADGMIYVTTIQGVARVPAAELAKHLDGVNLVVDTLQHALRVHDRAVSLERRRALEPLVVQLLRRAREGLSAEEILRAAGGPGPDSADAEHRVRVLISRVRDLLGDPASIERLRDAGEYGKTRYRLSPTLQFALVEPLYTPQGS